MQWTGNCIAKRNYHYFYRFVSSVTVFSSFAVGLCVDVLVVGVYTALSSASATQHCRCNVVLEGG